MMNDVARVEAAGRPGETTGPAMPDLSSRDHTPRPDSPACDAGWGDLLRVELKPNALGAPRLALVSDGNGRARLAVTFVEAGMSVPLPGCIDSEEVLDASGDDLEELLEEYEAAAGIHSAFDDDEDYDDDFDDEDDDLEDDEEEDDLDEEEDDDDDFDDEDELDEDSEEDLDEEEDDDEDGEFDDFEGDED